jgi:hypothetical protein
MAKPAKIKMFITWPFKKKFVASRSNVKSVHSCSVLAIQSEHSAICYLLHSPPWKPQRDHLEAAATKQRDMKIVDLLRVPRLKCQELPWQYRTAVPWVLHGSLQISLICSIQIPRVPGFLTMATTNNTQLPTPSQRTGTCLDLENIETVLLWLSMKILKSSGSISGISTPYYNSLGTEARVLLFGC